MAVNAQPLRPIDAASQATEKAVFVTESAEFALDQTIAPETRFIVGILYRKAALEAVSRRVQDGLRRLGTEPFEVSCSYDELVALTPWNRSQLAKIFAASKPMIEIHGSPRGGYRYRVNVTMRTYRMQTEGPIAPSILRENRPQPAAANRRKQMALGDELSSTVELKASEPCAGLSSTLELKGDGKGNALSSPVELKAAVTSRPLSSSIESKSAVSSSCIEPNTSTLSPLREPKEPRIKGRTRDVRDRSENSNSAADIPEALLNELLLLYRVKDKNARVTSMPFLMSVEALLALIAETRGCDRPTAIALLAQIAADPSWLTSSFTDPLAYIRKNVKQLLALRLAASSQQRDPRAAFFALPVEARAALLLALADGAATNDWLRRSSVSREAAAYARQMLAQRPGIAGRIRDGDMSELEDQHV